MMITSFLHRSQMDRLHVQGLLNQAARPYASNLGLDTSLNSQIMGLDHTQQVKTLTELSSLNFFCPRILQ